MMRVLFMAVFLIVSVSGYGFAQTSYYLSKDKQKSQTQDKPKPKVFLPSQNAVKTGGSNTPSVASQALKQEQKMLRAIKAAQNVDPRLLTSLGPGPQTQQELMAVATAHKAKKVLAVMEMQAARRAAFQNGTLGAPVARSSAPNSGYQKTLKPSQSRLNRSGVRKPPKVFRDY